MLVKVNSVEQFDTLIGEGPVLVDFYADWCGPCRSLNPILNEINDERPEIKIVKVDIDKLSELAIRYDITAIPALRFIKDGLVVSSVTGLVKKSVILEKTEDLF